MTSTDTMSFTVPAFGPGDTDSAVDFFERNGFCVLRGALRAAELDELLAKTDEMQDRFGRGDLPARFIPDEPMVMEVDDRKVAHYLSRVTEYAPVIADALRAPSLVAAITGILGERAWLGDYFGDGIIYQYSRPGRGSAYTRLGWHADLQAQPNSPMFPAVTVTVHLDGTSPANGFLRFLPGSHLHGVEGMPRGFEKVPGEIPYYAEPGDLLLHDYRVWHSAARGTDDGEAGTRRHVRGAWYAGRKFDPATDTNVFIKYARY